MKKQTTYLPDTDENKNVNEFLDIFRFAKVFEDELKKAAAAGGIDKWIEKEYKKPTLIN